MCVCVYNGILFSYKNEEILLCNSCYMHTFKGNNFPKASILRDEDKVFSWSRLGMSYNVTANAFCQLNTSQRIAQVTLEMAENGFLFHFSL